jgi:fatty acid desaturase
MPTPDRLNMALVAGVAGALVALLALASRLEAWWAAPVIGVVFSYVGLTNYALLHEAVHGNLNSDPRVNYLLGLLTGSFFPIPYTMIRTTHQGHHLRNRTDFEMFDLYYPEDSKFIKYVQWYGVLCGLFWPFVPLAGVLLGICPWLFRLPVFHDYRPYRHLLGDIRKGQLWLIRVELVAIVAVFAILFWLLELRWQSVLICYGCFSVNWSTRQYVGHAYSKRHVIDGAWNLRTSRLLSLILMHGEYDLNHHRRPDVPWYYLPRLSMEDGNRPSYFKQYLRQWLGPRPVSEPAPESLREIPLSVH